MSWLAPCVIVLIVSLSIFILTRLAAVMSVGRSPRQHPGREENITQPLSAQVKALADNHARKIQAIKKYREETGAGLVEAKNAIEAYINERR